MTEIHENKISDAVNVRIIASNKNCIEGEALLQLENASKLPGIVSAVGMPDIHPGKGCPVGAAFLAKDIIYPHLVGNDVGCGMSLWKTDISRQKIKRDKWAKKLTGLETPWEESVEDWLKSNGFESVRQDNALGTIGGGNHFSEIQIFEKIYDHEAFTGLGLNKNDVMLLIHSGSRGIGEALFRSHASKFGAKGLSVPSEEANQYLERHEYAMNWAVANRTLIAERISQQLGFFCTKVVDLSHNNISSIDYNGNKLWLHRKGAAPACDGVVVIPGTRGTLSYIAMPIGEQQENAWSVAHGAGRKWNRSSTKDRLQDRFTADSFMHTDLGSTVICEDKELLFEEAPQAYKDIDVVIQDMVDSGMIKVIATLKPVITYKVRKEK